MTAPLAGLRVVELASDIAGPYATKLLADAGADVVKIEHPDGGDPLRRWSAATPDAALQPGDDGALFRFLNASKRSVAIDWRTPAGRAQVRELAATADVVVESLAPEAGLDFASLADGNARGSLVSVSFFGREGPWRDRAATDFTLQAWGGSIAMRGTVDRPPLAAGGRLGEWLGGGYAAIGALSAVAHARLTGRGQHVDVSLLEVVHLSMAPFATVGDSFTGRSQSLPRTVEIPSIEPAADGWVGFCTITNQQWRDFLVLIERPELVDDAELAYFWTRNQRRAEIYPFIHAWTRRHTIAETIEQASLLRIPVAPIGNGETVARFDHFVERGAYVALPGTSFVQPRPPYRLTRGRLRDPAPAPALGQHTAQVLGERRDDARPVRADAPSALPFAGLRVVDFTMFWAGPFVTHYLATLGADVIKVESIQRPDGIRFASSAQPTADSWWEWSPMFHGMNAGKRGVTLDLSRPEGVGLARALIARSDVAVENFSPRVLDNLGLRWEDLARENPRLVLVRMPAFGLDGPWRDRVGFAQTMEQISGMAWLTGFRDGPPVIPRGPCDPLAGMHAVLALLVALEHRRRTGEGQLVEATMVEAALNAAAEQVLEWQASGTLLQRDGNRSPLAAPQNLYACRGEEQWLALAVATDEHWSALCDAMARPAWTADPELATRAGRRARHDALDRGIAAWCAERDLGEVVDELVRRGVPAAPVVPARAVDRNPQLRARRFFEPVTHPVTGTHELPGLPMRFSGRSSGWYASPAPTLGQHGRDVLREILGIGEDELDRLEASGIIGDRPAGL
ncbi:MAG TPA: CoA transferase [Candidatus Binatia bacterium]|nr:CoA transferase [Candidatus Binatia bacterium]